MLKRTPLFAAHQKLGGRLIEFGGWEMPVQYSSIIDEHLAVRNAAGIFDICHMGEVRVSGPAAADFLNHLLTNDIRKLEIGLGQYTILCNERGGAIDDLYAYRVGEQEYLLIINASRIEPDTDWIKTQHAKFPRVAEVELENLSDRTGAVAVQGPRVVEFINKVFPGAALAGTKATHITDLRKNQIASFDFAGEPVWISRTGYTGEDGFEIVSPGETIEEIWNKLLEAGAPFGLKPAGLGARDTLRTEVCYPLYGHELDENTTPLEAGVGFFVALNKDFIGQKVLSEQKTKGTAKKLVAFKMAEKSAPPRPHYLIFSGDKQIGEVTSGTQSPSLGLGIGLGYIAPEFSKPETKIEIEIRGKHAAAVVVAKPIYRKTN